MYIFFFLEHNDCTPPKCGELSEYTVSAQTEVDDIRMGQMRMINAGTTPDNFILPSLD